MPRQKIILALLGFVILIGGAYFGYNYYIKYTLTDEAHVKDIVAAAKRESIPTSTTELTDRAIKLSLEGFRKLNINASKARSVQIILLAGDVVTHVTYYIGHRLHLSNPSIKSEKIPNQIFTLSKLESKVEISADGFKSAELVSSSPPDSVVISAVKTATLSP